MTQEMTKREKWQHKYELKMARAQLALMRFARAELGNRNWADWDSYKALLKEANKAYGVMLRCGTRNPNT